MSSSLRTIYCNIFSINILISFIRPTYFVMSYKNNFTFILNIFLILIIKSFSKFFKLFIKSSVRQRRIIVRNNRSILISNSRSYCITYRTERISRNTKSFKCKALHSIFLEFSFIKNIKRTSVYTLVLFCNTTQFIYCSIIITCYVIKIRAR